jgi:methyltransferase-like protein
LDEKLRYFGNFEQLFKGVFSILKNSQEAFSLRNIEKKVLHIDLYNKNENIQVQLENMNSGMSTLEIIKILIVILLIIIILYLIIKV